MAITIEEARGLSYIKWEWIVNHNGKCDVNELLDSYPMIHKLQNHCGYCELFYDNNCVNCPLAPEKYTVDDCGCCQPDHPYYIWCFDDTVENAQKVLDLIKKHKI